MPLQTQFVKLFRQLSGLALVPFLLSLGSVAHAQGAASNYVWVEGESPASVSPAGITPAINDNGKPAYLSGAKWLSLSIEAADVDKQVPADGIVLTYNVSAPQAASYAVWDRVGFEKVRSPFDWRVDDGAWQTIAPAQDTVDVEELQTWNPVAWLPLGTQQLSAGAHTLQIRIKKSKDDKGNTARLVYASDALCLAAGPFHPDGKLKPGDASGLTDADKAAATQAFTVPVPTDPAQTTVSLKGDWQITPDDEMVVDDRLGPIKSVPNVAEYAWQAVPVPSDRNATLPELAYVHRYWLRTRVSVPAQAAGHSFLLHLPSENMIATVFVNGQQCGWTKTPYAVWDCDITRAVKPGQTNEILVGIKDAFYGLSDASNVKHPEYTPYDFWHYNTTNQLDMPVLFHYETGLLREPSLVVAGKAYVSDVFALPSVKTKSLGLEVTVSNPTGQPLTVSVANEVQPLSGGTAEATFAPQSVTVPAGSAQVVKLSQAWPNPKLWWPDDPQQYSIVTTLSVGGQPIDRCTTKFGFREWTWNGVNFALNGIPWHGRADTSDFGPFGDDWLKTYHAHGQNMIRYWGEPASAEQDLDWYDAHGVCVRRTDIFDGEGAAGFYSVASTALWANYRDQLRAWIRGQRNHPSIFIWSVENEITFINSHVFGQDQISTDEHHKTAPVVTAADPTRPYMVDGGNALLDESFPVYGGHYMEPSFQSLPDGAYDKAGFAHRQVWPVTKDKPILLGESFYATGNEPADFATVGGESAFVGRAEASPAIGLTARMLSEGYRWNEVNFHFWEGGLSDLYYNSWQPVAVLCRQWDWTFAGSSKVVRTLKLFNDTRFDSPITLAWTLTVGGRKIASQSSVHQVPAGGNETFPVTLTMPAVTVRQEGQWTLALTRDGKPVFKDVKAVSVLPVPARTVAAAPARPNRSCALPRGASGRLAVYDPTGAVTAFLRSQGTPFVSLKGLNALPATAKVVVIGKNALSPAQSTSSALAAYASAGRVVIVLEQKNPLKYQGLPGEMQTDSNQGQIAFAEDLTNPILHGLTQKDFFTWGGDGLVYKDAYVKPLSGGKSLVECSWRLQDTALAQMQAGKGLLLLSQLVIGEKLPGNPVAQRLLSNMIAYGLSYKLTYRAVAVAASDNPPFVKALDATGLRYRKAADPLAALTQPGSVAVINASPANLHALASRSATVKAFTQAGGWIVLNNLTPDGLADYNKLVGVEHLIRPFRQEKVTFPTVRNPLTAGLATSNIVMGSGKQIFNFSAGQYPDTDAYSYVVDYDDVAPFAASMFFAFDKIVNNYTMADGFWPLIINYPALTDGKPTLVSMTLPRPEKITQFTWASDNNYEGAIKVNLTVGDKPFTFDTQPNSDPQTFPLSGAPTAKDITLQVADWQHLPNKQSNGQDLVGIDNIYLKAYRSPDFYKKVKPMLNIGALMEYPQGAGGIVLCNVKYQNTEANPENVAKKQAIIATLLRNLQAPFTGGKTIIAGAGDLVYAPLDLSKQANQFTTDRGWFGDKNFTFADLPGGKHTFAGVTYNVYNFTTSPVPTAIMLGGPGIPGGLPGQVTGIPVNRKADALFFLQAARLDQRRNGDEIKNNKQYEMADYVIHYADGQTVKVPVYAEINVDDYHPEGAPAALPGAQIAWQKSYADGKHTAAAYAMQWNNPRPNVTIQSIDLTYGPDRRGVPALLAVTAATAAP